MRIKLTVAYDGLKYSGWQRQKGVLSAQEVLENGIQLATGKYSKTFASGRTDEGVSAIGQVVHFDTDSTIPPNKMYLAINKVIEGDVKVLSSEKVDDNFNARFDVLNKTYRYRTYVSEVEIPFETHRLQLEKMPDIEKMQKACQKLIGEHDFKGFSSTGSNVSSTVRRIFDAKVIKTADGIDFLFTGSGFLYNMVRILVGTLLDIGFGRYEDDRIEEAFKTGDRKLLGRTAKPYGLMLERVEYKK